MSEDHEIDRHIEEFRRRGGGSRQSTIRALGGKLGRHGASYHKERLLSEHEEEGPQTVEIVETSTCSFGHTIDDKVRVAGICEIGGEVVCSMEGCTHQCVRCGAVVCRRHSRTYGEKTYCTRHSWIHYWRKFWGLE